MDAEIKIGSEVRLKGNPQRMAVEDIQDGIAYCVYLQGDKKVRVSFSLEVLELAPKRLPPHERPRASDVQARLRER